MLEKVLDLFLESAGAKRIVRALVDRALLGLVTSFVAWLHLAPDAAKLLNADALDIANKVAPWIVIGLFAWLSVRKSQRTELTIETARVLPGETPRALIDLTVQTLLKQRQAPTVEAATMTALDHVITGPEGQLAKDQIADALNNANPVLELLQKVPPGTIDRTD